MFNRKEFNERIQQEFEELKELTSYLDNDEVFEMAHEIDFKSELAYQLQNRDLIDDDVAKKINDIEHNILDFIFDIHTSNFTDLTFEIINEAIDDFEKLYNEEANNDFEEDLDFDKDDNIE